MFSFNIPFIIVCLIQSYYKSITRLAVDGKEWQNVGGVLRPLGTYVIIGGDICYKRRMQHAGRKKDSSRYAGIGVDDTGSADAEGNSGAGSEPDHGNSTPAGNGWSHHMETDGTDAAAGMVSGG